MRQAAIVGLVFLAVWALTAYVVLPAAWRHYEHQPSLAGFPKVTETPSGIPGDPLNIGLVAAEAELVNGMLAAGWFPADAISLSSSLRISKSVLLGRPYTTAPVSTLMLFGRKQDFAFEKPFGKSAKQRHHVRFWRAESEGPDGKPLWLGAATFDVKVGFSHRTGQVTHHIAADVDAERDSLLANLTQAGQLVTIYQVTGVGLTLVGRNGGGDRYFSDGELSIGVIADENKVQHTAPLVMENPPAVELKNEAWAWLRPLLDQTEPAQ
ncbi:MAG TPA: LssY C-terminal domain-containing protein [Pirellulales bacterium]|nr:LssY C-terminal domain-containing protein [Pirellulales bacterium]